MNSRQWVALRVGGVVILVLALFPPWRVGSYANAGADRVVPCDLWAGHAFLFHSPDIVEGQVRVGDVRIDLPLLLAEWVAVAAVAGLAASFLRDEHRSTSERGGRKGVGEERSDATS